MLIRCRNSQHLFEGTVFKRPSHSVPPSSMCMKSKRAEKKKRAYSTLWNVLKISVLCNPLRFADNAIYHHNVLTRYPPDLCVRPLRNTKRQPEKCWHTILSIGSRCLELAMCVCVCICACMHVVCVFLCVHTCMHVCVCGICVCMHVFVCVRKSAISVLMLPVSHQCITVYCQTIKPHT